MIPSQETFRRRRSLVRQAVRAIVLAELVCMVALTSVSIWHERRVRLRAVDVALEGRADSLFGAVQDAEDPGDHVELDAREMRLPRGDAFAVYDLDGRRLGLSPHAPGDLLDFEGEPGLRTERWRGRHYRILRRTNLRIIDRAESNGVGLQRPVLIVYATPLDGIWQEIFAGVAFSVGASLLLLGATTVLLVAVLRRLLQPLAALAEAAEAVSPRHLFFDAPEPALALEELRPLGLALNGMVSGLREAFQRQHQFLGDAAHELKTAVAVVRSSLQVTLLRPRSPEEYQAGLERAVEDNERVEDLVARMLLTARVEERKDGGTRAGDMNAAVRASLEAMLPVAESAGISLLHPSLATEGEAAVQMPCLWVSIPEEDLQVLIRNLVINSVEHSARDGTVCVVSERRGSLVELRVIDQGEGIPAESVPYIFERFYRADTSRTRKTGGVGLGLSIVRAIVEGGGGTIRVKSERGLGTEMIVSLPQAGAMRPSNEQARCEAGPDASRA